MPIKPNFVEQIFIFNLNRGPGLLLDIIGPGVFSSLNVALKMNLFEVLDKKRSMKIEEIAKETRANMESLVF